MEHEVYNPKNIFSGNVMPVVTDTIKLKPGQSVNELSVIYYDSTNKEFFAVGSETQTIGADKVYALSTTTVEASDIEIEITVYMTGEFNESEVVLSSGQDIEDYIIAFRSKGIFLK